MKQSIKQRIEQLNNGEIPNGYNKTDFGVFPCDWATIRIGEVSITNGKYGINAPACEQTGNLPKYLRITDIDENGRYLDNGAFVNDKDSINYLLKKNDIVFARTGASVGKSYLYNENDGVLAYAGFLIKFSIDPNKCNPYLLKANCTTTNYDKWVSIISARSGQPGINAEEYASYAFVAPKSVTEQKKIAEILMKWDEAIELQEMYINKLTEKRKNVFRYLFNKNDDWESKNLKRIINVLSGYAFKSETYVADGEYLIITIANVNDNRFVIDENTKRINILPKDLREHQILQKDDIVMSLTGNVARICKVSNNNCLLNQRVAKIEVKKQYDKDFVFYLLQTFKFSEYMKMYAQGAAQDNLSVKDIYRYKVYLPKTEKEQKEISGKLVKYDVALKQQESKLELLKRQRKALQQYLLNGIVRV